MSVHDSVEWSRSEALRFWGLMTGIGASLGIIAGILLRT